MPMHDWTRVEPGIFHAFHHEWISEISRALNRGLLPEPHYALSEQVAAGFGPDVLTLQGAGDKGGASGVNGGGGTALQSRPRAWYTAESPVDLHRRRKSTVVIRHYSGDQIVAMVEIISPGNKSSRHAFRSFVDKVCELLELRVHLLLIDSFPPGPSDPNGIHSSVWEDLHDESFTLPERSLRTLVSYECDATTRGYIETVAVGEPLPDMALFLEPDGCVMTPLEATYSAAFAVLPRRWRDVLDAPAAS